MSWMERGWNYKWRTGHTNSEDRVIHHTKYFSLSEPALTHKQTYKFIVVPVHALTSDTGFKCVLSNDKQTVYKYRLEIWMWEQRERWFGSFCTNTLWSSLAPVYFSEIFMSWICFAASIEREGNPIHYVCDGLCIMLAIGVMNIKRSVLFFRQSISGLQEK